MAKKIYEEENIRAIAEKIREKTGSNSTYKTADMPCAIEDVFDAGKLQGDGGGYGEGYEEGKQAEYDRFWDSFQQNGTRRNYPYGFAGSCWKDDTYKPKYEIIITNLAIFTFAYNSVITSTKVPITVDTAASGNFFVGCTRLKEIPSIKVTEKVVFSSWFSNCYDLETINFTTDSVIANNISFADSTKLTRESLMSIINALKDFSILKTVTYHQGEYGGWSVEGNFNENGYKVDPKGAVWTVTDTELNGTTLICHGYCESYNLYDVAITVEDINISAEEAEKIKTIQLYVANYDQETGKFIIDVNITILGKGTENRTLTITEVNLSKLTESEKKKATDKGWILA
jgi:hypothetical protein